MHPYFVEFPSFEDIYNIDFSADVNLTALNFSLDMQLLDDIVYKLNSYNLPFDLFVLDVNGDSPIQCSQLEIMKPSTYKLDVQTITIRAADLKTEFTSEVLIPENSDNREQSGQNSHSQLGRSAAESTNLGFAGPIKCTLCFCIRAKE